MQELFTLRRNRFPPFTPKKVWDQLPSIRRVRLASVDVACSTLKAQVEALPQRFCGAGRHHQAQLEILAAMQGHGERVQASLGGAEAAGDPDVVAGTGRSTAQSPPMPQTTGGALAGCRRASGTNSRRSRTVMICCGPDYRIFAFGGREDSTVLSSLSGPRIRSGAGWGA